MSEGYKYEEMVELLLPCNCNNSPVWGTEFHLFHCQTHARPVVAAALRELGFENDELKTEVERLKHG